MDEKGLGKRLQEARLRANMTQQALCQKAGLSYSTLTKIERGAIKSPSIFTIQTIANALGTSLDNLLGNSLATTPDRPKKKSKSGIQFVYFDINGCLVRFFHRAFTELSLVSGAPADVVESIFWHYNDQVCRGEITMNQFNATLAKELNIPKVDWAEYYLEAIEPMPVMNDLVHWAAEFYKVGLLTNIMPGLVHAMIKKGILPDVQYDAIVDSSEVKSIKPEAKIFEVASDRANYPKDAILLIDDSRTNIMAAEKHGWHVLWFDDYRPDESVDRIREALAFED